jgi:hypothetical protein
VPHAPGPSLLQAPPPAPPRPAAPQPAEEAPAWEQFASDTGDATARLDAEPDSGRRQLRLAQSLEASRQRRRLLIITGAVGPALALLTGFIIWYSLSGDDTPPRPPNNPARNPVTFYVGPEAEYTSLLVVIRKVRPGDRIVVQGDIRAEIHVDEHEPLQGVTIEADEKKPEVVWRPLLQPGRHAALLQLNNAENVTIKGFTFDGDNKAANLILLECGCKDVRLENVKLRNFAETGVRFRNCMAEKDRPVVLSNVQANSDKPPLLFEVLQAYAVLFPKNEHIIVRENCQFAGKELSRNNLNAYVTILLQNQPIAAAACSSYFLTVPNVTIPNRALKPGDNAGVQLPKPLQWAKEELLPAPLPK